jgi:hypothetical protein
MSATRCDVAKLAALLFNAVPQAKARRTALGGQ